ncbi:DUF4269 domain-containing protein [Flavobacterium sp. Sd200]|uniref:DUF4269 domain-containing protein n=1 Tax=Flavobacterium sp. Sd200 TaxID=2692211 RepID=UPI00136BC70E|nr:DUF4269 domain-containing protein [Flavobacterium sp. Sd200]MXN89890.1 DUF4269 domain-containing protein [Flavobacterium sp. Sd200]
MYFFDSIDYLQHGTPRQKHTFRTLSEIGIIEKLAGYSPTLAGTIPINIDIDKSDLDILCHYTNADVFYKKVFDAFSHFQDFKIVKTTVNGTETVLANFYCNDFEIEIFGQPIPVHQQNGYLHMIAEYQILVKYGEPFRKQVIALKEAGYKTEPAFAKLLGLEGDPYEALLNYRLL